MNRRKWLGDAAVLGVAGTTAVVEIAHGQPLAQGRPLGEVLALAYEALEEAAKRLSPSYAFDSWQKEFTIALFFAGLCLDQELGCCPAVAYDPERGQLVLRSEDAEKVAQFLGNQPARVSRNIGRVLQIWQEAKAATPGEMVTALKSFEGTMWPLPWPFGRAR